MAGLETLETPQEARLGELDRVLEQAAPSQQLTDELFAVVDLLAAEPALRRALTDPGRTPAQRTDLARSLLAGKISDGAMGIVDAGVALAWRSGRGLESALERQAVRSELSAARAAGTLDEVEEQLFRFARVVEADHGLREALADRSVAVEARRDLVSSLLSGKADEATMRLARRAVGARERTLALTIEHYLGLSASLRRRQVAHVTVARPLPDDQADRLRAALSKQAGHEVELQVTVDPSVIGGVRVTLGDDVIEGTVAGRLADVRRSLG